MMAWVSLRFKYGMNIIRTNYSSYTLGLVRHPSCYCIEIRKKLDLSSALLYEVYSFYIA
jgi:hypothetical protein